MTHASIAIIGAGPLGLELAAALKLAGVDYLHFDAAQIGHTINWFPRQVRFFSSPERIAICAMPLHTADQEKATREEYLAYLRGIVEHFDLHVRTHERVARIEPAGEGFVLHTKHAGDEHVYACDNVVVAIGDMHRPRMLNIPGEELPHVSHYFVEPHEYFRKNLLIVGGRNSAVEAAIRCQRAGARVSISYRRDQFDTKSVKYWLTPEIEVLIKTGQIACYPQTVPTRITQSAVTLAPVTSSQAAGDDHVQVDADFVLLLTGYEMDGSLLESAGVQLHGDNHAPRYDTKTMQTNVAGLYVAGTAAAGTQVQFRLFIENCHQHVDKIVRHITGRPPVFDASNKTNKALAQRTAALPES